MEQQVVQLQQQLQQLQAEFQQSAIREQELRAQMSGAFQAMSNLSALPDLVKSMSEGTKAIAA
eukprot:5712676-Amphidinium_carterae.1